MTGAGGAGEESNRPATTFYRVQGMAAADAKDVEGNREGPWVATSKGTGDEVVVEGETHRGSFGDAEGHKDWVHQHQASSSGGEARRRDGWLRR